MMNISVVITNYNYAGFAKEAVVSAKKQLSEGDELIVIDDGSTDESREILQQLSKQLEFTFVVQKHAGQLAALRRGVDLAQGEIIAFLDSDDYFLPGYLDRLRKLYRNAPDTDFAFSSFVLLIDNEIDTIKTQQLNNKFAYSAPSVGTTKWAALYAREWVGSPTSGLSMRSVLAKQIFSLPPAMDSNFQVCADDVLVRCASVLSANKHYFAKSGFAYRFHAKNNLLSSKGWLVKFFSRQRRTQLVLRESRKSLLSRTRPSSSELLAEISGRSWPQIRSQRFRVRAAYIGLSIFANGPVNERFKAASTALARL